MSTVFSLMLKQLSRDIDRFYYFLCSLEHKSFYLIFKQYRKCKTLNAKQVLNSMKHYNLQVYIILLLDLKYFTHGSSKMIT